MLSGGYIYYITGNLLFSEKRKLDLTNKRDKLK